jgi:hypothetical protein
MFTSIIRPGSSRVSAFGVLLGAVFGIVGLAAALVMGSAAWSWWGEYRYLPVQAQVEHVDIYSVKSKRRSSYRSSVRFGYRADGQQLHATGDVAGSAVRAGDTITVWFDPQQPGKTAVTQQFEWAVLPLLPFALIFLWFSAAAFLTRIDFLLIPARGRVIRPDPGHARLLWIVAGMVNLASWPLAGIAAVHLSRGGPAMLAGVVVSPLLGLLLAYAAGRKSLTGRRFGRPLLEIIPATEGFRARVHFDPPLAARSDAGLTQIPVQIEIRQIQLVRRGRNRSAVTAWAIRLEAVLARGSTTADFSADVPHWPTPYAGVKSAFLQISLVALGATVHFRLAPELSRAGPASTT